MEDNIYGYTQALREWKNMSWTFRVRYILLQIWMAFVALAILMPLWFGLYWEFFDRELPMLQNGSWGIFEQVPISKAHPDGKILLPAPRIMVIRAGGTFPLWRYICFTQDAHAEIQRSYDDGISYQLVPQERDYVKGCGYHAVLLDVPSTLAQGFYTYKAALKFDVNPLFSPTESLPDVPVFVLSNIPGNPALNPNDFTGQGEH